MAQAAKEQSTSRLGAIRRGRIHSPPRLLLYGVEGVGKSTLAAAAPKPIFLDIEGGADHIDVARYTWRDGADGCIPRTLTDVYMALADLGRHEHEFETLVIDTLDALEPLVWAFVCDQYSGKKGAINKSGKKLTSIEDFGFAKGYIVAVDEWRKLCSMFDRLRAARGMSIILLGHSHIRTYKNPIDEDYDRFYLRVHDKSAGMLKEWADVVGFCAFEELADRLDGEHRSRGVSTGRRLIHLTRSAAWDAKSRIALPDEIEIDLEAPWQPFADALSVGSSTGPKELRALIEAELTRVGDALTRQKVEAAMTKAGDDASALSKFLVRLQAMTPADGDSNPDPNTDNDTPKEKE